MKSNENLNGGIEFRGFRISLRFGVVSYREIKKPAVGRAFLESKRRISGISGFQLTPNPDFFRQGRVAADE